MRKRYAATVAAAAVAAAVALVYLVVVLASEVPVSAGANVLQNGGFESPGGGGNQTPDQWVASTAIPYRSEFPEVHSGEYAAYLHGGNGSYTQTAYIGADSVYRFEVYSRADGSATETVTLAIRDSIGSALNTYHGNGTEHGWMRREEYFVTPENAWDAVVTLEIGGSEYGEAWFDDVVLEEKPSSSWCFIATAAYGSDHNGSVDTLRAYRDRYLMRDGAGRAFASAYYDTSPSVAWFIDQHPSLKPLVRAALMPALAFSAASMETPVAARAAMAGVGVWTSMFVAFWLRRRAARRGLRADASGASTRRS
jgi:hypothetical protein